MSWYQTVNRMDLFVFLLNRWLDEAFCPPDEKEAATILYLDRNGNQHILVLSRNYYFQYEINGIASLLLDIAQGVLTDKEGARRYLLLMQR